MEKLGKDGYEESSQENKSDKEDDSESEKEQPPPRKIIRAKKSAAASQPAAEESKSQARPQRKSRAAKTAAAKKAKDESESEDMDAAQMSSSPKIGQKRKNPATSSSNDMPSKRVKRLADGSEQVVETKKKAPVKKVVKMPTVFKAGKWNPTTELVEVDIEKEGKMDKPDFSCCKLCNMRNLHRAVHTDDPKLLEQLVLDKKNIANMLTTLSSECTKSIIVKILEKKSMPLLEALFPHKHYTGSKFKHMSPQEAMQRLYCNDRVTTKAFLMQTINTGHVSRKAYGTNIRSVNVTRGNRQGNNAFNEGTGMSSGYMVPTIVWGPSSGKMLQNMDPELFEIYKLTQPRDVNIQPTQLGLEGNREMVAHNLKEKIKHENFGFNQLHYDVVKLDKLTDKYATASITKKGISDNNVTPLHFACINPNVEVLEKLLNQSPEVHVADGSLNKPIHFAACCSSPEPLKLLLEKGANVFDVNNVKKSALHFAALCSRPENVTAIIGAQRNVFKLRDRQNCSGFVYALKTGD